MPSTVPAAPRSTMDSPMAMRTTRPKRSLKCDALLSTHRLDRTKYTPVWSTTTDASHHQTCAWPPTSAPTQSKASAARMTPSIATSTLRMFGSFPAAMRYTVMCTRRTTEYAATSTRAALPCSSNACGMLTATKNIPAMATIIATRSRPSSALA